MADDFDKFERLWGDPDDEGDDGPRFQPFPENASKAGIEPVFMAAPDARHLPASHPVQWRHYEQTYGFKPYKSPTDEFECNENPLNRQTLLYRWAGLNVDGEIERLFADHTAIGRRAARQEQRLRESGLPNYSDPTSIKIHNNRHIHECLEQIRALSAILKANIDCTVEQYFKMKEGTSFKEEFRTMNTSSRARVNRDLRNYMLLYQRLTGQDAKHVLVEHELGGNLRDVLQQGLLNRNQPTLEGASLQEILDAQRRQLGPLTGDVIEGEEVG